MLILAQYKRWFEIGAIALVIIGLFWAVHSWSEKQREIGREEIRKEYAEQLRLAKEASDKVEKVLRERVDDAVTKGNEREQTIRTLASANSNASIGLRNATASIGNSLPSLSQDALRNLASAYGSVLTECNARLGEMATNAERLNSEKMTLIQAWPTAPAEAK
jgi:hypothetical protein